jgi:MFS transporter, MHS family, proline/betaine transporter
VTRRPAQKEEERAAEFVRVCDSESSYSLVMRASQRENTIATSKSRRSIFFSSIGEVVEWFDFMVYLSLAPILAKVIFAPDRASSLAMTLGIFGAAFLARPLGALLFGHLGDRFGRKRALVTSALLMALAKLVEGLLPTYATVGHLAPAIFLLARIGSGFSLGGEFTGTGVMLFESAQPRRRASTTSLANIMGGVGVFLASALVGLLSTHLSPSAMESWGWRIPFFAGSLIGLVALVIRAWVPETPLFEEMKRKGKTLRAPLRESLRRQPRAVLLTFALAGFNALSYYLVVAFVPTYLVSFVKVDHATAMHVATVASAFNVAFIAIPARLSDAFGRKPLLVAGSLGFLLLTYPLYLLLSSGSMAAMLASALGFVALATFFMGPAITAALEHFPTEVRFSGFAFGYNIGAGLFGGTTPLVATWLIQSTGSLQAPSFYLIAAAAIMLVVCLRLKETLDLAFK